jgi:hypothetical protein
LAWPCLWLQYPRLTETGCGQSQPLIRNIQHPPTNHSPSIGTSRITLRNWLSYWESLTNHSPSLGIFNTLRPITAPQ